MYKRIKSKLSLANNLKSYIQSFPEVKDCFLQGSLAGNNYDIYSDIDIKIDVSGFDPGKFMLELAKKLEDIFPVIYVAYAPGLFPIYVVSVAIDENDVFSFIDFECVSDSNDSIVSLDEIKKVNDFYSLMLKLTIGNLKYYLRKQDCKEFIIKIAKEVNTGLDFDKKSERQIMLKTLECIEEKCGESLILIINKCKTYL